MSAAIALYLIRKYQDADQNLLLEKQSDHKRFTDTSIYEDYEYAHLLKNNFAQLTVDKQEQILSWIENPELDYYWLEDQEKKAESVRYWQWHKLTIIKDKSGWGIYGWRDETKTILSKAIQSSSDKARKTAENIIQELGKRGHWQYRDLLP